MRRVGRGAGGDDFVHKPFQSEVIFEKIAQSLGVRYVYENAVDENKVSGPLRSLKGLKTETLIEALSSRPPEWLTALYEVAVVAKTEPIFQLIEQMPETEAVLADALVELVNDFRWGQIQTLVRQTGKLPPLR